MNVKQQPWSTGCVFLMFWCIDDDKNILMRSETMTSVCLCSALFQFLFGLSPILCIFWFAPCCVQPTTPITAMTQRPSSRHSLRVRKSFMVISMWLLCVAAQGSVLALQYCHAIDCLLFDYHVQKIRTSVSEAHPHARTEWIDVY